MCATAERTRVTPSIPPGVMTQLSAEECGIFQEKLFKFPGFSIQRRTIRQYSYNSAGHVLGDIGEVSMSDIEKDDYYIRGDYIGKQGIERSYEKYLRGEKGVEVLLRDAHGRIQGHYMDGKLDRSVGTWQEPETGYRYRPPDAGRTPDAKQNRGYRSH